MWILRDFKCNGCEKIFEELTQPTELVVACDCGKEATITTTKVAVHGADSFNSHYCEQLGQHFSSAEHKQAVLKKLGKKQDSGQLSPRRSNKSSINMTKAQALKHDPSYRARMPKL